MQNRAPRVITGRPYEVHSSDVLKELGMAKFGKTPTK
jgi:hypothetical protein